MGSGPESDKSAILPIVINLETDDRRIAILTAMRHRNSDSFQQAYIRATANLKHMERLNEVVRSENSPEWAVREILGLVGNARRSTEPEGSLIN